MDLMLEELSRQLTIILNRDMATVLSNVETEMSGKDASFYAQMGQTPEVTTLVAPVQYFVGHDPLLMERPMSQFPTVSIMATNQDEASQDSGDTFIGQGISVFIEAFVVAADEVLVNRIAWRYAKALHRIVNDNKTLDQMVSEISGPPRVEVGPVIAMTASNGTDEYWLMQGIRLDMVYSIAQNWY